MESEVNPYRLWLGLTSDRPSNHYELLGLAPFETDGAKIAAAGERAITKVRSFRPGPNARAWAQLLDEIRAAKGCLCDTQRRAEYDTVLRGTIAQPVGSIGAERSNAGKPETLTSAFAAQQSDFLPPSAARRAVFPTAPNIDTAPVAKMAAGPLPVYEINSEQAAAAEPNHVSAQGYTADAADVPMALPIVNKTFSVAPDVARLGGSSEAPPLVSPIKRHVANASVNLMPPGGDAPMARRIETPDYSVLMTRAWYVHLAVVSVWLLGIGLLMGAGAFVFIRLGQPGPGDEELALGVTEPRVVATPDQVAPAPQVSDVPLTPTRPEVDLPSKPSPEPVPETPAELKPPTNRAEPVTTPEETQTPALPQLSPAPESADSPLPASATPLVSRPSRSQLQTLIKALETAREAISEHNFKAADVQIAKAEAQAQLKKHQDAVARLKEIGDYVKQFRVALAEAVSERQAAETFKVGASTEVLFVEGFSDKVTIRTTGASKTYSFNDMPPGLALALVDFKLPVNEPMSRVIKGAYLATHKRANSETQEKAETLWSEAQAAGTNVMHLMPFFGDKYSEFLNSAVER